MTPRLLIVGNPLPFHIGAWFMEAAREMGLDVEICDTSEASAGSRWLQRLSWRLLDKRPSRMRTFGDAVLRHCERLRPSWLLVTGIAPLDAATLEAIGQLGIRRLNFLTDDAWNPAHRAEWFLKALSHYDHLFSPRRAALDDLSRAGAPRVSYLPFGYAPHLHFAPPRGRDAPASGVIFVGGGDRDRAAFFAEALEYGLRPALYGGYWGRFAATRPYDRGHVSADEARELTAGAVNLCLVRRANRDGHVMRSFEIPACGGCMLAEDTEEHRAIFGAEGEAVLYFSSAAEAAGKAAALLADHALRRRLAQAGNELVRNGRHTYRDRLSTMLEGFSGI